MTSTCSITPFSQKCKDAINKQINFELTASYLYKAFSIYFSRHDVALPNVATFFKNASAEEQEHADKLIEYLLQRGGNVVLHDVKAPQDVEKLSLLDAFTRAFQAEKNIHQDLRNLHAVADEEGEVHFAAFLEEEYLAEQIHEEADYLRWVTIIKRMGTGLGEQLFDKEFIK